LKDVNDFREGGGEAGRRRECPVRDGEMGSDLILPRMRRLRKAGTAKVGRRSDGACRRRRDVKM